MRLENHEKSTMEFKVFSSYFEDHPEARKDRKMMLYAVGINGTFLRFASPDLQADHDIVLAAVKNRGEALMYASPEWRKDPEIVMAAIQQNGRAIQYSPLKNDIEYVMVALQQINFDPDWSNMYGPNDPIFVQVHERMQAMGIGTGARQ